MAPLKAERQTATVPQIWIVEIETPFFRRFSAPPPPVLMTTTSGPSLPSLAAVCALAFTFLTSLASADDVFDLVVVYPGGPNPGSSQQNVIDDFVSRLTGELSLTLKGTYFNDTEAAAAFLADHPNSFVFGSTGFFLAQREALSLVPELTVILPDGHPEQYFLVSRKGAFSDLASMKGKSISGSPLYESSSFLDQIVFAGKATVSEFELQPTNRPLSALRKLTSGDLDGVLLGAPQYHSLSGLPLADELDTVFASEPIASVGFMRTDNESTAKVAAHLTEALIQLSQTSEGAEACKGFGVAGFATPDQEAVAKLIESYEAP